MKKLLMITLACLVLMFCACAEETQQNVIVYFQDGSMVLLPAEIANDPQALADYCSRYFPGRLYTSDSDSDALDFDATISADWVASREGEGSRPLLARLVKLGLTETTVITSLGEEVNVPTHYLKFADGVDGDHLLGIVYAPRTGEATIRETEGGSAKVIGKGKSGKVVAIMEYNGGTFTKIRYEDDVVGYIRTDCLLFHNGKDTTVGSGTLHNKGNVDGSEDVTVYAEATASKAKPAAGPTGTKVIIHTLTKGWYAVEADGWYGWVQEQYLMPDDK